MTSEKVERKSDANKKGVRKPYVKKACVNCKNAHAACDEGRPCKRCVAMGMEQSCIDAERKKPIPKSADKKSNEVDLFEEEASSSDRLRTLKLQQSKAAKSSPSTKQKSKKTTTSPIATTTTTTPNLFALPPIPPVNFNLFSLFPPPTVPSSATIVPPTTTATFPPINNNNRCTL